MRAKKSPEALLSLLDRLTTILERGLATLRGEGRAKEMAEHLRKERIGF